MLGFSIQDLIDIGFPTNSPHVELLSRKFRIEGNIKKQQPAVTITMTDTRMSVQPGTGCTYLNVSNYNLPRLALLLRGLNHDYYAKLVEEYLEKAARKAAIADFESEDDDAFDALV